MSDHDVDALPWYTYPSIEFLRDLLQGHWRVFEYGAGSSTRFYSEHCAEVHTIEHSPQWHEDVSGRGLNAYVQLVPRDAPIIAGAEAIDAEFHSKKFYLPNRGTESADHYDGLYIEPWRGYASQLYRYGPKYFDVVACDGMARSLTLFYASKLVKDDGYIVLDNSDRWQYNALQRYLIEDGFGRVEFWGKGPRIPNTWCTAIFSKNFKNESMMIDKPMSSGDIAGAGRPTDWSEYV